MSSTSGYIETAAPPGKNSRFYVEWNLIGQDIGNNTSTIAWRAGLNIARYDLWYNNAVRIDGGNVHTAGIGNGTWSNLGPGKHQLRSGTVVVNHNGDGSGAFGAGINGWLYSFGNRSTSGSWNLPTIPRATNPTMPGSFQIGSPVTINLPRASGSFHHRVRYDFNGQSGNISDNAGSSVVWNTPSSLANRRPNNESGTGTVTVETWNGGSHIGTRTIGFTANVPNTSSFLPTITNYAVEEANELVSNQFSFFIQNKSQLALSMTAQGAFGSTILKTNFIFENWVSDGKESTAVSPIVTGYGQRFIGFITQDSRSRSNEDLTFTSVEVEEYVDPFAAMVVTRCDSTGAWDEDGNHVIVYPGGLIAPLRNENTAQFILKYKKRSATTWTEHVIDPVGTGTYGEYQLDLQDDAFILPGINVDDAYDFRLEATDFFGTGADVAIIPTAFTLMDFHASGRGVSFGKVATNSNRFEIGPKLPFNVIAATSTEADKDLATFRRSDDTLLAKIQTGEGGTGLKIRTYNTLGANTGTIPISPTGQIPASNINNTSYQNDRATLTYSNPSTGSVHNIGTTTLGYNTLESGPNSTITRNNNELIIGVTGEYLITANLRCIDVPRPTLHTIKYQLPGSSNWDHLVLWMPWSHVNFDSTNRSIAPISVMVNLVAGTKLIHQLDVRDGGATRVGGSGAFGSRHTCLSVSRQGF